MNTLFLCEFFGFFRIAIPPLPYIDIQKHPKHPSRYAKSVTRMIRVDTFI